MAPPSPPELLHHDLHVPPTLPQETLGSGQILWEPSSVWERSEFSAFKGLSSQRAQNKKSHLTSETLGISNVSVLFITKPRKKALKNSWCE